MNEPSTTLGMAYLTEKYKISEGWTVKAGTGFAMRMPELSELYLDEPYSPVVRFGNSYTDGNSDLRPERDLQFDLGLSYKTKGASFGIRGFYSIVSDYILPVPVRDQSHVALSAAEGPGAELPGFSAVGAHRPGHDQRKRRHQPGRITSTSISTQATLCGGDLFAEKSA